MSALAGRARLRASKSAAVSPLLPSRRCSWCGARLARRAGRGRPARHCPGCGPKASAAAQAERRAAERRASWPQRRPCEGSGCGRLLLVDDGRGWRRRWCCGCLARRKAVARAARNQVRGGLRSPAESVLSAAAGAVAGVLSGLRRPAGVAPSLPSLSSLLRSGSAGGGLAPLAVRRSGLSLCPRPASNTGRMKPPARRGAAE